VNGSIQVFYIGWYAVCEESASNDENVIVERTL